MRINRKKEIDNNDITSYREYLYKNRELEKAEINEKILKLQKIYDKAIEEYMKSDEVKTAIKEKNKERYETIGNSINIKEPKIVKMNRALETLKNQLYNVDSKYKIDSTLKCLAHEIDIADYQNEAVEISDNIIKKLEELIIDMDKAENLFRMGSLTLPIAFNGLRNSIVGGINFYNANKHIHGSMKVSDKNRLVDEFNKRKAIVDEEKKEKEEEEKLDKMINELVK